MTHDRFARTVRAQFAAAIAAEAIGRHLHTGTVFNNRCDYLDPALCWSGCKETSRGAGMSVVLADADLAVGRTKPNTADTGMDIEARAQMMAAAMICATAFLKGIPVSLQGSEKKRF